MLGVWRLKKLWPRGRAEYVKSSKKKKKKKKKEKKKEKKKNKNKKKEKKRGREADRGGCEEHRAC